MNIKTLTKIAILSAISFVLMLLEFNLPFIPPFYKLDFSEVAVLVGGFALGPFAAICIEGIKVILNIIFTGTSTAYIGEIANFFIGCSFCVPAALIYKNNKSKSSAIKGLVVGAIAMTVLGVILNYAVLLPAYSYFYHMDMEAIIGIGSSLIPAIHDRLTFVLFATTPFNIIKGILVGVLTTLLYKRISPILHR